MWVASPIVVDGGALGGLREARLGPKSSSSSISGSIRAAVPPGRVSDGEGEAKAQAVVVRSDGSWPWSHQTRQGGRGKSEGLIEVAGLIHTEGHHDILCAMFMHPSSHTYMA